MNKILKFLLIASVVTAIPYVPPAIYLLSGHSEPNLGTLLGGFGIWSYLCVPGAIVCYGKLLGLLLMSGIGGAAAALMPKNPFFLSIDMPLFLIFALCFKSGRERMEEREKMLVSACLIVYPFVLMAMGYVYFETFSLLPG